MATKAFPFDAGSGANVRETDWTSMAKFWRTSGILPDNIGWTHLILNGVSTHVNDIYGDFLVTGNSSTLSVDVAAGSAWIMGHHFWSDATINKVLTSNSSGYSRIDRVVLRLDWVANTITVEVLQGTPGASPTPPALTQTLNSRWEISLAKVTVPNGATLGTSCTIEDERIPSLPQDMIVAGRLYSNSDPSQTITNATYTNVNFLNATSTHPTVSPANDNITILMPGVYLVVFSYRMNIASGQGLGIIGWNTAGGSQVISNGTILARNYASEGTVTAIRQFNRGDFVWGAYYQTSGSSTVAGWTNADTPSLVVIRLGDGWS